MPRKLQEVLESGSPFRLGEWRVEPRLNRVSGGEVSVQLELKAMDVLVYLAHRAGEVVSRFELQDAVWQTEFVADNTLVKRIAQIREALGDNAREPRFIETIPKRGYRLIAPVAFQGLEVVTPSPCEQVEQARRVERPPYPGLQPFTEADADDFFGREAEIVALWRRIASRRLLAVVGPSGAGKSSLLRAGVVARAPPGWRAVVCQPGEDPMLSLARALAGDLSGDAEETRRLLAFHEPDTALAVAARWRGRWDEALIVVDQFEEVFTLSPPVVRERFVGLLRRLVDAADVHVVLGLRDDFLLACHRHRQLAPIFSQLTPVGPPDGAELRRAVVEPAARRGFAFESELLVDEMVGAVEGERGALPLLAFAALKLWELRDRERRLLTREAYERIGGVDGALAQHAETTLEAIGHERLQVVRELFRNLVTAEGTRSVRRADDLLSVFAESQRADAEEVLRTLVDARLLTSYRDEATAETTEVVGGRVEIVHESLLAAWPRLVRWQAQGADGALLRDQLRQAAQLWVARGRPEDLLWDGASYREYGVWRERYLGGLSAAEEEFAVAMTARAGRRRRRRRVLAAVLVAALVTVAVTVTALWRRAEHQARRVEARRLFEVGRQSLGRSPPTALAWAIASLERADDGEARRLALAALQSSPMPTAVDERQLPGRPVSAVFSPDGQWLAVGHFEGAIALWPASGRSPRVWQAHRRSAVPWIAPGSQTLLSLGFGDPHFALWTLPGAERIGMVERQDGFVQADLEAREARNPVRLVRLVADPAVPGGWNVDPGPARAWRQLRPPYPKAAVTPDGGRLVFADGGGLYEVEIAEQVGEPRLLGRNPAAVEHVTFHPDGARFATFDVAGVARVWSAATAGDGPLQEWQGPSDTVCDDLRFDPSGRSLAAAFGRGDALLWDLDAPPGADPLRLAPAGGDIIALAFHPGGRFLATAALAQLAVWPLDRETYPQVLRGHSGRVDRVAFSPDAAFLVSAGSDGTVRRWPLTPAAGVRPRILYRVGHPLMGAVASVAVSPDGGFVVACTGEASARVIPLDGSAPRTLGGFDQRVLRAAVGPGGTVIAVPGVVGGRLVVRTWDLVSGESATLDVEEVHRPEAVGDWLELATTPHGGLLVTSGGPLVRWDLASREHSRVRDHTGAFATSNDGTVVISRPSIDFPGDNEQATVHSLRDGTETLLTTHGPCVHALALDATGAIAVTGGFDGVVRVGPTSGAEPHLLVGHAGSVVTVAVSPDGRRIASGSSDGTIRLWPMPDLQSRPMHTLPLPELLADLEARTNLRALFDDDHPEGYVTAVERFPSWSAE